MTENPPPPDRQRWLGLDAQIRKWWDQDLIHAWEEDILSDKGKGMLFLPFPYLRISADASGIFQQQYPFDTAFMNYALLAHDRADLARNHILNHLFMIERYGYALTANQQGARTRSQTPFVQNTMWRYYLATKDLDLLHMAYPLLKREYRNHWNGPHHQTPIGLSTCHDFGDPGLSPELAAEAEHLDFTPVYGGDIRRCVPVGINCALVGYARVLALMAKEVGRDHEAAAFSNDADKRTSLIHKYCWTETKGLFLEYDFVAQKQLPYISEFAYWTMWSGVASRKQAARLLDNLHLIEKLHGVACTDKEYPDPHTDKEFIRKHPAGILQFMYPAGWASTQLIVTSGLDAYGYSEAARRISAKFLNMLLVQYEKTGQLWEKYNVVDGSLVLPNARYGVLPYHSFTAAAVVLLGRRVFENQPLQAI